MHLIHCTEYEQVLCCLCELTTTMVQYRMHSSRMAMLVTYLSGFGHLQQQLELVCHIERAKRSFALHNQQTNSSRKHSLGAHQMIGLLVWMFTTRCRPSRKVSFSPDAIGQGIQ